MTSGALERVLVVLCPGAAAELRGVVARMLAVFADGLMCEGPGPVATGDRMIRGEAETRRGVGRHPA